MHDDERRGLGASLGHAEQRSHSELPHSVLIEDFKGETVGLGHPARAFSEGQRGEKVGWFHRDVARQIGRFADDPGFFQRGAERGIIAADRYRDRRNGFVFSFLAGLEVIRFPRAEDRRLGDGLDLCRSRFVQRECDAGRAFSLQEADGGAGDLAQRGGIEFLPLARSRDQHAAGFVPVEAVQQSEFEEFSGDLARAVRFGEQLRQFRPAARLQSPEAPQHRSQVQRPANGPASIPFELLY